MTNKYLKLIPKPLLDDIKNNRVVPFVGAGFSMNADLPKGLEMPNWTQLGQLVAKELPNCNGNNNAIDILSYYEDLYSRTKLIELLMKLLHTNDALPGDIHRAFCEIFSGTICTTNFDFLLEKAMSNINIPFSTIVTEDRLTVNAHKESRLLKLHGDFNHPDKMVITEHDYDTYIEKNPVFATYVSNLFVTNTMLLIGYSLDDQDFRGIWQILNNRLGGMTQPAYCIVVDAKDEKIARYRRRNIHVINLIGDPDKPHDYKTVLLEFLNELKEYLIKGQDANATSKDDKINEQFLIPPDNNKLCFISCASKRIAQLSAFLYPILQKCDITPIRIDDILTPNDNWIDVSRTAIRKSRFAIVDISDYSEYVFLEFNTIVSQNKEAFIICEDGVVIPDSFRDHIIHRYTLNTYSKIGISQKEKTNAIFIEELTNWFAQKPGMPIYNKEENEDSGWLESARRLFNKEEYSASIISAFSDLEFCLRTKYPQYYDSNFIHYINTVTQSSNLENYYSQIKDYRYLRNKIVHGKAKANEAQATAVLECIDSFIHALSESN